MLNHFPPLPLLVSYGRWQPITAKDEERALLALQQHDRVRSIYLKASTSTLEKLFAVMNRSFPALELLGLSGEYSDDEEDEDEDPDADFPRLPPTFEAPHLEYLDLVRVGDIGVEGMPLLTSISGLVSLSLTGIPVSFYLPIEYLASRLSFMPKLEYLRLSFDFYLPSDDIRRDLNHAPNVERISLPELDDIFFEGDSSYLEGLAALISALTY